MKSGDRSDPQFSFKFSPVRKRALGFIIPNALQYTTEVLLCQV